MKVSVTDYIKPLERQREALRWIGKGKYIFYGGARGGGKSHFCLDTAFLAAHQYPGIQIIMIRQTIPELEEVFIENMRKRFPASLFGYVYKNQKHVALFNNGSRIIFRPCENIRMAERIKGAEYQLMIIDEAVEFDERVIMYLVGSLRNTRIKNFSETLVMTGNPGGRSDYWFKTHFIDPDYKVWRAEELKFKDKYVFIPAKVWDNEHISQVYVDNLQGMEPRIREAWLNGNWNVFHGQFFDAWNKEIHVIADFPIPKEWRKAAGLDIGGTSNHPTACVWGAQDPKTNAVYIYREYESVADMNSYACDIAYRQKDEYVPIVYADPSMFGTGIAKTAGEKTNEMIFVEAGVNIVPAFRERVNGWRLLKQWLSWTPRRKPKLFIFESCTRLTELIPLFRYDTRKLINIEDMDTTQSFDDYADALRYLMATAFGYPVQTAEDAYPDTRFEYLNTAIDKEELMAETTDIMTYFTDCGDSPRQRFPKDVHTLIEDRTLEYVGRAVYV